MGDVGFAKEKSGKYHFFFSISSVTCWPLTNDTLYMMELVLYLIAS